MARYDIYKAKGRKGYLLDIQSDLLDALNTRVVVPLMPLNVSPKPADRLNPVFLVGRKEHVMVTQFLSAVPVIILTSPAGNLAEYHSQIIAAIDMLTQGY